MSLICRLLCFTNASLPHSGVVDRSGWELSSVHPLCERLLAARADLEVEADGFLGGLGIEKGTRGYLPELRLLVVVGDPGWSRFQPRILGPLFPW
mgnify:CR=1 FL=1